LQAQDGTFYGTDNNGNMIAFSSSGNVIWSVPNDYPQIATADGGVIGASGITYDNQGRADGQIGTPRTMSWNENFYTDGPVDQIASAFINLASSFEDSSGGNPSGNNTSTEWFGIGTLLLRNLSGATGVPGTCADEGGITVCDFEVAASCTNQPRWTTNGVIDAPPGLAAWWTKYWCVNPVAGWQLCKPVPGTATKTTDPGPAYCQHP
jgi:hypothetical protein